MSLFILEFLIVVKMNLNVLPKKTKLIVTALEVKVFSEVNEIIEALIIMAHCRYNILPSSLSNHNSRIS